MTKTPKTIPTDRRTAAAPPKDAQDATELTLEHLVRIDLTPSEALDLIHRDLKAPDTPQLQRTYEALRSAGWKLLTARLYGDPMRDWQDVFRRAAALFRACDAPLLAERTLTLAELALESARFGAAHDRKIVAARPQVRKILSILKRHSGQAMREIVLAESKLGQANLSRILATLASVGFIERDVEGREVRISLTRLGYEALTRPPGTPTGAGGLSLEPGIEEDEEVHELIATR